MVAAEYPFVGKTFPASGNLIHFGREMQLHNLSINRDVRILRLRQARVSGQPIRLRIISPSDAEKDLYSQLQWSDYWIKYELIKALGQLPDLCLTDYQPHAVLHLFGFPAQLDPRIYTMGWIYGHPDMLTDLELLHYDHLFCYSSLFQKELQRRGYSSELMIGATGKLPATVQKARYPATFVGNARAGGGSRPAVDALLESGEDFRVWGKGWEGKLSRKNLAGSYFDYAQLNELYASSEFVLNDHHPDMARWGFVSFRIYDALASGGFVVSDRNPGIKEIFSDTVPQFSGGQELREILTYFRAHPQEKERLRKQGMRIALSHAWESRAAQIYWHLMWVADPALKQFKGQILRSALVSPAAQKRWEAIHQCLQDRMVMGAAGATKSEASEPLNGGDLLVGRPKVLYLDLFRPENSNLYWLRAFKRLAEVDTFDIRENFAELKDRIRVFHPDHIHLGGSVKHGMVKPELLQEMKDLLGCSISVFYGDAAYSDYHAELSRVVDRIYITNKTHIQINSEKGLGNFSYLPCPTDPEVFKAVPAEKTYDLLFIGNNNNDSRLDLLKRLGEKFNLAVAGANWEETGLQALPSAYGEHFSGVCAKAKILLGLVGDEWKHLEAYFSNRLVNVLATGSFLIQTYTPGLEEVFTNREHLVWYQNEAELFDLIGYYVHNDSERRKIARAGQEKVLDQYTYERQVARILEETGVGRAERRRESRLAAAEARPAEIAEAHRSLKLHLGCGSNLLEGYVNIDKYYPHADRVMDVVKLDYPDGSVEEIFTSHMIEHVPLSDFLLMLREWKRVLKSNGRLVIRCPNFELYLKMWLEGDENYRWGEGLNVILGMQDRGPGYQNRNMFTARRLKALVEQAGFGVLRCEETATRTGHIEKGDLLCIAVHCAEMQRQTVRGSAPSAKQTAADPLDEHWRVALKEAENGGRFTWAWYQNHPITRELLGSRVLRGKVLEIGCGTGQRAAIAHQQAGCQIVGMDASALAVGYATKNFGSADLQFCAGDVDAMPFPEHSFDNAYMLAVIEHIPDTQALLAEVERVLVPGGHLFLSVTENDHHSSPDHVHVFTAESLKKTFAAYKITDCYVKDHIIFLTAEMPAVAQDGKDSAQEPSAAPLAADGAFQ